MHLLVDIGNTRAKWALFDGRALHAHEAAAHAEFAATIRAYLADRKVTVDHTLVANVAGQSLEQTLTSIVRAHCGHDPRYLQSTTELCGLRSAYRVPERLGVDRWVAMIGARSLHAGPLCVVSVGTAMTIDVVNGADEHQGGLIVPGLQLLISSLLTNTSEIASRAAQGQRDQELLAVDTLGAITQGAEQMLAALVDRVSTRLEKRLVQPLTVVMTGGGAAVIRDLLSRSAVIVPDLTLRGLAVVADRG